MALDAGGSLSGSHQDAALAVACPLYGRNSLTFGGRRSSEHFMCVIRRQVDWRNYRHALGLPGRGCLGARFRPGKLAWMVSWKLQV
ncbi:uncharacterized protein [Physcomitrium patens]|uniref:uncharacterized protein isoform X3 n=1 Tax=Physcomitrium patens TaxID=3218 RepID=UPI003CCDE620